MKKLVAVVSLLSLTVLAAPQRFSHYTVACTTGTCTASAPSAATDGMSLSGVASWRVQICSPTGTTLSGAGTVRIYIYNPDSALWSENIEHRKSQTVSGERCSAFGDFLVGPALHGYRLKIVLNGVTASGSTNGNVDVRLDACLLSGC